MPEDDLFSKALFAAFDELQELKKQESEIAIRKSQLQQTVEALMPLVFRSNVDIKSLSLPDAMRLVLKSTGRPLNAHQFQAKLDDIGFDLEKYKDPMASILTAMNRMADAGEFSWVQDAARKTVEATPELKSVPESPLVPPDGTSLQSLMEMTRELPESEGGSQ